MMYSQGVDSCEKAMRKKAWKEWKLYCTADKVSSSFKELWNGHYPKVFPLVKLWSWASVLPLGDGAGRGEPDTAREEDLGKIFEVHSTTE